MQMTQYSATHGWFTTYTAFDLSAKFSQYLSLSQSYTSWGTSCSRSNALMWSKVSIDGERPPWRQNICTKTRRHSAEQSKVSGEFQLVGVSVLQRFAPRQGPSDVYHQAEIKTLAQKSATASCSGNKLTTTFQRWQAAYAGRVTIRSLLTVIAKRLTRGNATNRGNACQNACKSQRNNHLRWLSFSHQALSQLFLQAPTKLKYVAVAVEWTVFLEQHNTIFQTLNYS